MTGTRVHPGSLRAVAANRRTSRQLWAGFGARGLAKVRAQAPTTRARRQRHATMATSGRAKLARWYRRDARGRFT